MKYATGNDKKEGIWDSDVYDNEDHSFLGYEVL
jgi:hypothetical protein